MKLPFVPAILLAPLMLSAGLPGQVQKKRPAPEDAKREVQFFAVKDLVEPPDTEETNTPAKKQEREARNIQALTRFIRTFIQPPLEKGDDVKSLGPGNLVVLARPDQVAWVHGFLDQNRKKKPYLLNVQAKFVHMNDKAFEKLLRPLLKKKSHAIIANTKKSNEFMIGLQRSKGVTMITAPRYLAQPLQQASVWMGSKIVYVSNYEIRRIDSPKGYVADPVIEEARDGILFEGTAAYVKKGVIGLDFRLVIAEIHKPLHTETLDKRQKNLPAEIEKLKLTVSLPETTKTTLKTKAEIPNKGWGIFSLGRRHKKHWILILNVEEISVPK